MSDKLPAMQWYIGDWRKDTGVQSLDYESRGIWRELLDFMWESPERGVLVFPNGEPMDDESIAKMLGIPQEKWEQTRSKLEARGVAHIDPRGAIGNRRMLRFEATRAARAESGRKGGLSTQASKRQANGQAKPKAKPSSSVAVAVSVSPSGTTTTSPTPPSVPPPRVTPRGEVAVAPEGGEVGRKPEPQPGPEPIRGPLTRFLGPTHDPNEIMPVTDPDDDQDDDPASPEPPSTTVDLRKQKHWRPFRDAILEHLHLGHEEVKLDKLSVGMGLEHVNARRLLDSGRWSAGALLAGLRHIRQVEGIPNEPITLVFLENNPQLLEQAIGIARKGRG